MFALHGITLTNFRSYRGAHEFVFPVGRGLYFFTGQNLSEPALGANAAGKSTLLDAITWVLFGRTTRGLKANEVLSWGATSCAVTLELTVGKNRLQIQRTQKPNGLFLDDKPVDQVELEKHIRLNFDSFLYAIINTQFGQPFLSLAPSAKLTLFSDIMNLDFWLKKSDEAATRTGSLALQIDGLQDSITVQEGRKASLIADIAQYEEFSTTLKNTIQAKVALKKQELARAANEAISLDEKITEIGSENTERLRKLEAMREISLDNIMQATRERSETVGKLAAIKEQQAECKALSGECPVCRQGIDHKHMKNRLTNLGHKATQLDGTLACVDEDLAMYKKQLVKIKGKIDVAVDEINEVKAKKDEAKILRDKVRRLEAELVEIKAAENPYDIIVETKQNDLKKTTLHLRLLANEKDLAEAGYEALNFWIKGFKRVRLFIIEQAFRTLEIEVNNSLAQLGMTDWQITFDVERENKSGGITKGFVVFVKSPSNEEPVRWESWSGGETQRLQLAGDLGLANLIMQQHGLSNTIEFFDEPSTHLSPEGMIDLANMLHERAMSEGKQIWIVDHASITNFGDFEGIITVRKTKNGSIITSTETQSPLQRHLDKRT